MKHFKKKGGLPETKALTRLMLVLCLVALVCGAGLASPDPLNWWRESDGDPGAYDLTYELTDTSCYEWTLHFNGTTLQYPDGQKMMAFAVFDPTATLADAAWAKLWKNGLEVGDPVLWDVKTPSGSSAGDLVVEFNSPSGGWDDVAEVCDYLTVGACFSEPLDDPHYMTAIHVGGEPRSVWVNPTPELPPGALALVGMVPLAWARFRRRKS